MKKIKNIFALLVVALVGLSLTGCSSDDLDTNQYQGGVSLNAYGPNPVMRGGQLRFVGSNLDQIASVIIPGIPEITSIDVVKAGVPSEIRVTVPKDGPEVGYVTLKTKTDQTITTRTQLEYIEGIEITKIPEEVVMPGQTIKIEGDYLNLIYSMAFADGVLVSSNDFVSQDRYFIEVVVPEEAKTGKLEFYTADLTIQRTAKEEDELTYQTIISDEALTVGLPTTTKITTPRGEAEPEGVITAKAGEEIKLTGEYYNVISAIKFGEVEVTDFMMSEDGTSLIFNLPAEAPDGEMILVCKSGEEVPVCTLTTVKPSNCQVAPKPVKANTALTISGQDMDVVTGVQFPGADIVTGDNLNVSADKVVVALVPETATEGKLQLVMANGATVDVDFELVKPVATAYSSNPVSAGGQLRITGTDLDLVKSVVFGEAAYTLETADYSGTTIINVTVPMEGKSGKPQLVLANGTFVEAPDLTIDEAVFCYAVTKPWEEEGVELKAGSSMTLIVANGDKLTGVEMNGETCQWILTGEDKNQLIIGIPETASAKSTLRLVSSNGEISYEITVIPATSVNKTIWTGLIELTWNDGGRVGVPAASFEGVPAGAILTFCYTQKDQVWGQAQVNYLDWSGINFNQAGEDVVTFNQTLIPTDIYGWFQDGILNRETSVILTQEILSNILAKKGDYEGKTCGIVIQGQDLIFTKLTLSWEISLEIDLATKVSNMNGTPITYPYTFTWDDTGRFNLSQDLLLNDIGVKKGSKMFFYKNASESGQIQINNSSWSAITYLTDWSEGKDVLELEFDDAIMEAVNNGGLVLQGAISGITKMTILP